MISAKKHSRHEENRDYLFRTGQLDNEKKSRPQGIWAVPDSEKRRVARPAGTSLVPSEVAGLVELALADGGPIQQGDAYEHFLAVTCDAMRFYTYHFLIAPGAGGQRRAVLLTERTLHGNALEDQKYAAKLVAYASALGRPRVVIDRLSYCCSLARTLLLEMPGTLCWRDANFGFMPHSEDQRRHHRDNFSLAFERYAQAAEAGAIKHPLKRTLEKQKMDAGPKRDESGIGYLAGIGDGMDRDMSALCMVYVDEEHERNDGPIIGSW
ncbi:MULTISPECIES: hypothetical protein [unclassified Pseudomonas]|uniref:hypothetical protein n=1 Tax=unclassified Pseudomonas TaxID=196821 RepID=UPI000A1F9390|nr:MULTISPECIES: hypothetical protein [unclassified Pseudomonas]